MNYLGEHEAAFRLSVFALALVLFVGLETLLPHKARTQKRGRRWLTNALFVGIDTALVRVAFPIVAVGVAAYSAQHGWGLFNMTSWPVWLEISLAIIVLDMLIYWQHRAFHIVPLFWRFHKVHHTDRDLDASTALRFHPVEIVVSMLYKMAIVLALGPAVMAVILFEIILNASALFNHANIRLPVWLDKVLRAIVITPDFHRVHHSTRVAETNSNYGFFLSVWDYLFKSYNAQPKAGHDAMKIGLSEAQTENPNKIGWSLWLPFRTNP